MTLEQTIKQLPSSAGIYQYFDNNNNLLYIGKAKNLSNRVKSYFSFSPSLRAKPNLSSRIIKMISQTVSMHYILVNSEHDALILENSLIKQLNPKYNILLRDDKTYPYIYIDNSLKFPRYEITRKIIKSPNINYFGPFSVGAKDILDSIYEICKLVQKKGCLQSKKLCLYHQMDKCLGPCELPVKEDVYKNEELGNIEVLNGEDKIDKYIYVKNYPCDNEKINQYLLHHKKKLIERGIRKFNENNWFEWGAPRNITTINANLGKDCIYISNLTRKPNVAFLGKVNYFGGGLLMLKPKTKCNLNKIISYLNSNTFKDNFVFSGRFKIGQRQICNSFIPSEYL